MRIGRIGHLLAGVMLALIVAAPTLSISAPEGVESVQRLPPTVNGQSNDRHRFSRHRAATRHRPTTRPRRIPRDDARSGQPSTSIRRDVTPAPAPATPPVPVKTDTSALAFDKPLAANDAAIGEALHAIVTAKTFGRGIAHAVERKAIQDFYAAHNYVPLWIKAGKLTARAKAVIERLSNAATDGLSPSDYPVPPFDTFDGAEQLAKGDISLTYSLLTFARHLSTGRIAPRRVFAQVDYGEHAPDPDAILKTVFAAHDVDAAIESYNPPDAGFRALKRKFAGLLHESADSSANRIPAGPLIRPGKKDARIPLIRARLGLRSRRPDDTTYDRQLLNVVRRIQKNAGQSDDGIIGPKTLAVINGPSPALVIDTVKANMERWRWLPRNLGETYVMVNVPDFTLRLVHDHKVIWSTKIVAGKPQTPTPLVSASMDTVIVNPSWYVPQSIIHNELLPRYQSDPNIFNRLGLEVKKGPRGHINVVQPPGAANALGRIKFNFNNKFQVYLHDTPEKQLFNYSRRAFSHGCMRVQNPTKFGELILSLSMRGRAPNARQIQSMFGREEHDFKLVKRPMVHLTYRTAFVDDKGKLQLRDDIYGVDARIDAILNSAERRVADIAPPPDPTRDLETAQANQEILRRVERREAGNPFVFFEQLFR